MKTRRSSFTAALLSVVVVASLASVALGANAKTKLVSVASNGSQRTADSGGAGVSGDGRFVVFQTTGKFVGSDTDAVFDVYVRDRKLKKTKRVSVTNGGAQRGGDKFAADISDDGRFVVFNTVAALVGNDTNARSDIYVRDRKRGRTRRVSVTSSGGQRLGHSSNPAISADGRFIVFETEAAFVSKDKNNRVDVYIHDRKKKRTRRVSVKSSGAELMNSSAAPDVSADGRFVSFLTDGAFVGSDHNSKFDVYVHDRKTNKTKRVSVRSNGSEGSENDFTATISGSGRFVAFGSGSALVASDTNLTGDIYLHDRKKKRTKRVSITSGGFERAKGGAGPAISRNGRYIAFNSRSAFVPADTNTEHDVYVHDRKRKRTKLVSVPSGGGSGTQGSFGPAISADARFIGFHSDAVLVPGDTNAHRDVYMRGPLR